jgi:hypothetical protein
MVVCGANRGQIAQLKAQLACLSQQLDHLGAQELNMGGPGQAAHHGNEAESGGNGAEFARSVGQTAC